MSNNQRSKQIEKTLRELTQNFGFSKERSLQAIEAIGDKSDVQMAYNWLLDHGEEDKGGAVDLIQCPHLDEEDSVLINQSQIVYGNPCIEGCKEGENWICLHCGETRCSRYVKKHSMDHYNKTKAQQEAGITVEMAAQGKRARGHFISLSLTDLSVWCYECQSYVFHNEIEPLERKMRQLKFNETDTISSVPAVGAPLKATLNEMHGSLGRPDWAPPLTTVVCNMDARPNYNTCKAHEYLDQPHVLKQKVKLLAELLRKSQNCVAYTGAGISTAAGIGDYATKTTESLATKGVKKVSGFQAQPTTTHRTLVALYETGILKHWVQCNHDGLPQKAGYPQHEINEIHGGWYDPSNPVVPMSGTLRGDLMQSLLEWEEKTDLCLALGTSLCGMNADRMASTPSKKSKTGEAIGTVIISIQCTQYDQKSCLRIFSKMDDVMNLLAEEMSLPVRPPQPYAPKNLGTAEIASHIFTALPYNKKGEHDPNGKLTLDLSMGAKVKVVRQPEWDLERCGNVGEVVGHEDGHISISFGRQRVRCLGMWWIDEAKIGKVPVLPVINV